MAEKNTRKASATSKGESTLCYLFREDLNKLFDSNSKLGISIYKKIIDLLVEKLEYADDYIMKQNEKNLKQ